MKNYCSDCEHGEKCNIVRKETARDVANKIKVEFYREFEELIPSIMADRIDKIVAEYGVEVKNERNFIQRQKSKKW